MNYKIEKIYIEETNKEYDIYIGKNKYGNQEILKKCDKNSIWMHLKDSSSKHVILESKGDYIPKRYINQVGKLFSGENVIYTFLKNVKSTCEIGEVKVSKIQIIKFK